MTVMMKEKTNMSPKIQARLKLFKRQLNRYMMSIKNKKIIHINKVSLQKLRNKYLKTMKKKPMFHIKMSQKNKKISINQLKKIIKLKAPQQDSLNKM